MGSANGCCRSAQVDNNKVLTAKGNQPLQPQYGGAWGDSNGHTGSRPMNGIDPPLTSMPANGHRTGHGPGPGGGSGQRLIESPPEVKKGTSKAIGSVLLMFMNSFSQQPRDLLIHLGAGSQTVRPASFIMEDTETLKTSTEKQIHVVDTKKRPESPTNFHVPAVVDPPVTPPQGLGSAGSLGRVSSAPVPLPVIPTNYNTGAVSRIINSLNMIPARAGMNRVTEVD